MRLRAGNACWHAHHIFAVATCKEAGFFADEGLDVDVVHAKIYAQGLKASQPGGERYDEVGKVLPDMISFNIDIISDIHLPTVFNERNLGNDELRIIGGWRSYFPYAVMARSGIQSIADLKGKRIGEWYRGSQYTIWFERELRKVGLDPDRDVEWRTGYQYGSAREAWKPLLAGETDVAVVQNPWVPRLMEQGFNKIFDFLEHHKPHGRPERVTVARKRFIDRHPELIKRFWKATIRGYQFMRIVPENYPFQRFVEAKLRIDNPDESERMRPLRGDMSKEGLELMESSFYPLDGKISVEGVARLIEEFKEGGVISGPVSRADIEEVVRNDLVEEAWAEVSQTDEVKRNLERLQPVIEKYGY
jgi:ABC-type nitrate/sulfonate/bicarbonate transport system substrate-binding protein